MSSLRDGLAVALALWLAGCASLPTGVPPAAPFDAFHLTGRVSVRHGEEGFSGTLDWWHRPEADEVEILGPLGQGVARLVRSPEGAMLTGSDRQTHRAADVDSLTEAILGWRLPLGQLGHWVQARPAPGSAAAMVRDGEGRVVRLEQDGWRIEYGGWRAVAAGVLPGRLVVNGRGLRLKLLVDVWETP